ncbi:3'-5' RNA exonuclease complex component, partial [Coemansia sp. RSA 562]
NKVEGYKQFHAELLSMDHLLETLKEARTESQEHPLDEENEDLEDGEAGSAEEIEELKIDPKTVPINDREFQKLLSKSWELFDEDLAPTANEDEGDAEATTQEQSRMYTRPHRSGPAGTRSFHTTRQILDSPKPHSARNKDSLKPDNSSVFAKKNNTALKMLRSRPIERIELHSKKNKSFPRPQLHEHVELFSKKVKSPIQRHQSLVRQADLPTEAEILEHVSKSASEHIHVPIDSSVNVGDIVEMRLNMSANPSKEFGSSVYLGAIAQKTTGRFHLMSIDEGGNVFGSRENVLGFVAKGIMFDSELLHISGVQEHEIERLLTFRDELHAYEAEHGKHALTNATDAERLQRAQNQSVQQPVKDGYFGEPKGDAQEVAAAVVDEWDTAQGFTANAGLSVSGDLTMAVKGANSTDSDAEEDIMELLLRVMPKVIVTYKEQALRLARSHYRELSGYWAMALAQGKTRVTLDSLAELIFGTDDGKPISQAARLATYMHLVSDMMHFIPSDQYLFVTNTFELRPRKEVEHIEHVRDLIRRNAPEFKQFIEKARKLVAFSYARDPSVPSRAALSPNISALKDSMTCSLTGHAMHPEFMASRSSILDKVPSEQEIQNIKFNSNDQLFIDMMCRYVYNENEGYGYTENVYQMLAPPILNKMRCYDGSGSQAVVEFLVDLGVWPSWYNPTLNARMLPHGSKTAEKQPSKMRAAADTCVQQYLKGDPAAIDSAKEGSTPAANDKLAKLVDIAPQKMPWRPDHTEQSSLLTQSSTGAGVIDRTQFYGRDICENIRHDFGDMPVFTVDSAATKDVDDGVSIETVTGSDGKPQVWVHIHVADPTSIIHPGHVVADAASELMTTLYYSESHNHMLPFDLVTQKISLVQRTDKSPVNTMSFSALIGDDGNIVDYKVRPGLVRNITAVPYDLLDQHMSYSWTQDSIGSFAKIQDSVRNSIMVHPFELSESDWRHYGEGHGALSGAAIKALQMVQDIAIRHRKYRLHCGSFDIYGKGGDLKVQLDGDVQTTSMDRPKFLLDQLKRSEKSSKAYPRIWNSFSEEFQSPAHIMVSELMIVAGRVAARFGQEHGYQERDSSGVASGLQPVPLLYRVQHPPDLPMLNGCSPDMKLAFEDITIEQAQVAENVWNAAMSEAKLNRGFLSARTRDEVRSMMSPSLFTDRPAPHTVMGICDEFGYTRVTSPIRRMDDMVGHWQIKAQLLAEHGDARDKAPWHWNRTDMFRLAPIIFRRQFLANRLMASSSQFWGATMMQRMDFEARRGRLQPPPAGFYDINSVHYCDLPWAYYNPSNPGPLIWTAVVDNRDPKRPFLSMLLHSGLNVRAALMPRPLGPANLPFAGTKLRVQLLAAVPHTNTVLVKLAPEEYQPTGTSPFWKFETAAALPYMKMPSMNRLPENMTEPTPLT